jgi:hypothetical protein
LTPVLSSAYTSFRVKIPRFPAVQNEEKQRVSRAEPPVSFRLQRVESKSMACSESRSIIDCHALTTRYACASFRLWLSCHPAAVVAPAKSSWVRAVSSAQSQPPRENSSEIGVLPRAGYASHARAGSAPGDDRDRSGRWTPHPAGSIPCSCSSAGRTRGTGLMGRKQANR